MCVCVCVFKQLNRLSLPNYFRIGGEKNANTFVQILNSVTVSIFYYGIYYTFIHIYVCVCVCVCEYARAMDCLWSLSDIKILLKSP